MSISDTLDVGIGLILIYLLLSLVCSAAREMAEAFFKTRAMNLELGIRQLLTDPTEAKHSWLPFTTQTFSWFWAYWWPKLSRVSPCDPNTTDWVAELYKHPLISGLYDGKYEEKNLPAYIPARTFALALMDLVLPPTAQGKSGAAGATAALEFPPAAAPLQPLREKVILLPDGQLKNALLPLIDSAGNNVIQARENIENWFNGSMDRVSGWYKRHTQWILFWLGLGVTIAMNVNTLTLADFLLNNPDVRKALVARAEEVAKKQEVPTTAPAEGPDFKAARAHFDDAVNDVKSLHLPIGWSSTKMTWFETNFCCLKEGKAPTREFWWWLLHSLGGWLVTAMAISLGAPFWFDTLNRIMIVRSTVKPSEKKP